MELFTLGASRGYTERDVRDSARILTGFSVDYYETWHAVYNHDDHYRGKVKVYETPIVERTSLDALDRKAAIFEFEVDAKTFTPGLYTCQVNVIDAVAGQFSFSRLDLYVRAK